MSDGSTISRTRGIPIETLSPAARASLDRLFEALADSFAQEGRPGGDLAVLALRSARSRPYRQVPGMLAPHELLDVCSAQDGALPLVDLVLACRPLLAWSHWEGEALAEAVSANLYSTELVGPDGYAHDDQVRVGLLLSDKATDYPISRHSGEETYLVISGEAEWTLSDGAYVTRPAGTLVHHPAWAPHGRRTLEQPFLGAWRWCGDLDLSSVSVDNDGQPGCFLPAKGSAAKTWEFEP